MTQTASEPSAPSAPNEGHAAYVSTLARVRGRSRSWRALGLFSSVVTAACLIALVAGVILGATLYEAAYGQAVVQRMVYTSWWFGALFIALAVNIAGAAIVRWPWNRHQTGFVVVHSGLLFLILGFFLAGATRLDGQLYAPPGHPVDQLELPLDSVVADIPQGEGPDRRASAQLDTVRLAGYPSLPRLLLCKAMPWWLSVPDPGIHALPAPIPLLTESRDGVDLALIAVCDSARSQPGYVAAEPGATDAVPAMSLRLGATSALMGGMAEQATPPAWLSPSGERVSQVGPLIATIATTDSQALADDFLQPPGPLGPQGAVTVYWKGERHRVDVPATLPATIDISPDCALEITKLIPHARADKDALSENPSADLDPFLQCRLGIGAAEARTWTDEVLAARYLLPAALAGQACLAYQHPAVAGGVPGATQRAWLEALCAPDGHLYLRWFTLAHGEVGVQVVTEPSWSGLLVGGEGGPMQLRAHIDWLPHAIVGPEHVLMEHGEEDKATRWIELSARRDGHRGRAWVAKGDGAAIHLDGGGGDVLVRLDSALYSLKDRNGFALTLTRFTELRDPGGEQAATFSSEVAIKGLTDGERADALTRLQDAAERARARFGEHGVGRWLPPALASLAQGAPAAPPAVADPTATITMNQPLAVGGVTIYQISFQPEMDKDGRPTGRQISVFTVAQDRGRWAKYLGSVLLVTGILLMYFMRRRIP